MRAFVGCSNDIIIKIRKGYVLMRAPLQGCGVKQNGASPLIRY